MENVIRAIPVTGFNTATISGTTYYAINATGLDAACFYIGIINNSNISLTFSFDGGATPHGVVQANSKFPDNSFSIDPQLMWEKGLIVSVRNSAAAGGPGTGLVYLTGYYR